MKTEETKLDELDKKINELEIKLKGKKINKQELIDFIKEKIKSLSDE